MQYGTPEKEKDSKFYIQVHGITRFFNNEQEAQAWAENYAQNSRTIRSRGVVDGIGESYIRTPLGVQVQIKALRGLGIDKKGEVV